MRGSTIVIVVACVATVGISSPVLGEDDALSWAYLLKEFKYTTCFVVHSRLTDVDGGPAGGRPSKQEIAQLREYLVTRLRADVPAIPFCRSDLESTTAGATHLSAVVFMWVEDMGGGQQWPLVSVQLEAWVTGYSQKRQFLFSETVGEPREQAITAAKRGVRRMTLQFAEFLRHVQRIHGRRRPPAVWAISYSPAAATKIHPQPGQRSTIRP
jgi:hypothetical protein